MRYDWALGEGFNRDPAGLAGGINLYEMANNNPMYYVDSDGRWIIPVIVGGGAGGILIWKLPDWDATRLSPQERAKLAHLLAILQNCAKQSGDERARKFLNNMDVTGKFKPGKGGGSCETRNGRFFGLGNRTLLDDNFFKEDSATQSNYLLHESYHSGTEDWSEDNSYQYATDKMEKLRECLKKSGL